MIGNMTPLHIVMYTKVTYGSTCELTYFQTHLPPKVDANYNQGILPWI